MWPYFNFKFLVPCSGICFEHYWIQHILSLEAGWLKLSDFLFITALPPAPAFLQYTNLPSPSWPSFPFFLPCFIAAVCLSSVFLLHKCHPSWLIDMCWANKKCSSRGNHTHKLKLKWSILLVFFCSFVSVHSYNIIHPNRLEFEFVYIFHKESLFPKKKLGTKPTIWEFLILQVV